MKRCKQCNTEYDNGDKCPNCGSVDFWEVDVWGQPVNPTAPTVNLAKEQPENPTPPSPQQPPQPQNYNRDNEYNAPRQSYVQQAPTSPAATGSQGIAVAALVLGILSLVLFSVPFVGIGMGIVALCLGLTAKKRLPQSEQGMANAGFVLGIIGTVLGCITVIITVMAVAACNAALMGLNNNCDWYSPYDW